MPVKVIVHREPASGKTTFVHKVCKDWSELHLNEEPVRSEVKDALGSYDLLIPVILRQVEHEASLEDTIRDQILIDSSEQQMKTLHQMLENRERTIIIMDGLDEYHADRSSEITKIMTGHRYKHVIITTRPETARCKDWEKPLSFYKEAELLGLTDENIKLYVEKFFTESTEKRISLVSHIFRKDSQLLELARNVGSLSMMCILHCDGVPIHTMNREQLYQEFVAFLLSRWEQRQNPEGEKTPRSEILKKYHETLLKFGELSDINRKSYDVDGEYKHKSDDEDSMELSFTLDQIKSVIGEDAVEEIKSIKDETKSIKDALNLGFIYKSHPSSRLESSRYSFTHKTLHEFFLAYFIKHHNLESFKQRLYKNRDLLYQELSLTRFLLHLYMTQDEAFEFTTNIIGSEPDEKLFFVLLKLYQGYQHDEYQTTLTFNTTEYYYGRDIEYSYIYQYPCYVIRAHRRHEDSLSSYNKDMIRRMNTDNKHKAVTVPILQTASKQTITCGNPLLLSVYDFFVYCRADYEVTVTGHGSKLEGLYLYDIEKMGDINLNPVNDRLKVVGIKDTNLHGCVGLTKPWMALIQSLRMGGCKLEAGDISVIADSIQVCTSPTGAESASPCRLQELDLNHNSLTGAGADIARIISCIPLCTVIDLSKCKLEAGDISVIADSIQACTSPTGAESASPCRLQKLNLYENSLTGAGADIAKIISCIPLCTEIDLSECKLEAGDISVIADSIQACTSPTRAESASPCRLQNLWGNNLTGAGSDIARIIMLCTEINLGRCKLEAGDISVIADSIQACTSPTGAESASPCRLQKLDLSGNSLTGAGADIASIIKCIPLCTWINLGRCDLNDEDFHAIVNAIIQTHSDRHTSVHDHSTPDRRQTNRFKPASPGPASHIEQLYLQRNKFSDVETVRLLLDNLSSSLRLLWLGDNQFNKEEMEEIRRTYKDKYQT